MINAALAIKTFMAKNPDYLEKALIVRKGVRYYLYLWALTDPIKTVQAWKDIFGKQYQIRVAHSSGIAPHLNRMYDSAKTSLPIQGVRCKAG